MTRGVYLLLQTHNHTHSSLCCCHNILQISVLVAHPWPCKVDHHHPGRIWSGTRSYNENDHVSVMLLCKEHSLSLIHTSPAWLTPYPKSWEKGSGDQPIPEWCHSPGILGKSTLSVLLMECGLFTPCFTPCSIIMVFKLSVQMEQED